MPTPHPRSPRYDGAAAIVRETKEVQAAVVSALREYLELTERMREFEDTFSAQVLSAAGELFHLRTHRKRLEAAYRRIWAKRENGEYGDDEDIAKDVASALEFPEPDEAGPFAGTGEPVRDEELDAVTRERIYRAFRRIVLPRVHADTSDADASEFEVAYAAYESRDYTLMAAFIITYAGEIGLEQDGEVLNHARLAARLADFRAARKRLDARLQVLRQEITSIEVRAPDQARERMAKQGERLRRAITEESERIRELERRLELLARTARRDRESDDG